jgi:hypothetical protein
MIAKFNLTPTAAPAPRHLAAGTEPRGFVDALRAALAALAAAPPAGQDRHLQPRCDLRGSPSPFGLSAF